jgi:Helix-turn-helix domain
MSATETRVVEAELAELYRRTGIDLSSLPAVCTPAEVAPLLRVSEGALAQDRYRRIGLPYTKHGKRVRYLRVDIARYLLARHSEGGAK